VWFARFDRADPDAVFGLHRSYPPGALAWSSETFEAEVGPSRFGSGRVEGEIEGDGRRVRWDLSFPTGAPTHRPLPDWLYRRGMAPTRVYSPNVDTRVSGTVEVDGSSLRVQDVPAHQGHLFGTRHADRWAWAHCGDFMDESVVVHALVAQGRRGPLVAPYLTSVGIRWEGRWIRLGAVRRRRDFGVGTWRVDVGDRRYRLTGRIEAPASALIRARYEDPDGRPRFCHHTEVASARLALFERRVRGFEEIALLESNGTTHAEWAGLTPATAVVREHVDLDGAPA